MDVDSAIQQALLVGGSVGFGLGTAFWFLAFGIRQVYGIFCRIAGAFAA